MQLITHRGHGYQVAENIDTAGIGLTTFLKYRWTVYTVDGDGNPTGHAKTDYALSFGQAADSAQRWIDKKIDRDQRAEQNRARYEDAKAQKRYRKEQKKAHKQPPRNPAQGDKHDPQAWGRNNQEWNR